jgi:hypothetical protein
MRIGHQQKSKPEQKVLVDHFFKYQWSFWANGKWQIDVWSIVAASNIQPV